MRADGLFFVTLVAESGVGAMNECQDTPFRPVGQSLFAPCLNVHFVVIHPRSPSQEMGPVYQLG